MSFTKKFNKIFTFPTQLLRLWLVGFGIGTALSAYTLISAVQFLHLLGPGELGTAFLEAGLLTWVVFALYNTLHTYRPLAQVAQIFSWIITAWLGFLCLQSLILPNDLPPSLAYWAFLANFPIVALYQAIFWSMSEKILTAQELKAYRLVLNLGTASAQIIVWILIAYVFAYATVLKIGYLIATGGAFLTAALYSYYPYKLPHLQKLTINAQAIKVNNKLGSLFGQVYPNRLIWFVFLGALLAVQLDYLFWLVVNGKYAEYDDKKLANFVTFLASIWAVTTFVSFLIKASLYTILSKQYGVRTVLLAMPILLFFFLSILSILGGVSPISFVPENAFIFILLVLCEQIREVLNEAFQLPGYRLYLLPLEDELRADTQIKLDGFIAGAPLVLFGVVSRLQIRFCRL